MKNEIYTEREKFILSEVNKLRYTYGVNRVIRFGKDRPEEYETQSVAEHIANMIFCAYYFRSKIEEQDILNMDEVVSIILMHDMGEIETGDIPTTHKTETHKNEEREAIKLIKDKSPDFIKNRIEKVFEGQEHPVTLEERFARAIDKFEGLLFWFTDEGIRMVKSFDSPEDTKYYFDKTEKILLGLDIPIILEYFLLMKKDIIARDVYVR